MTKAQIITSIAIARVDLGWTIEDARAESHLLRRERVDYLRSVLAEVGREQQANAARVRAEMEAAGGIEQ